MAYRGETKFAAHLHENNKLVKIILNNNYLQPIQAYNQGITV